VPLDDWRGHGRTPAVRLRLDERDKKLVEIAGRFYAGLSHRDAAHRLRRSWLLYQQGRWRRTRTELRCPHDAERLDAALWFLLKVHDHVASEISIRRTLGSRDPADVLGFDMRDD
jgi:hypothetical protein